MSENVNEKKNWSAQLMERFDALMKKFDMPEDIQIDLRNFVSDVAREQYMAGNRNGIGWLRKKAGAKPGQMLIAGPMLQTAPAATV